MANVPSNPKLWQMLTVQARGKFATYPSLPASKWIHTQYVQKGGQFVNDATAEQSKKSAHASKQFDHYRRDRAKKKEHRTKDKDDE